MNLGQPVAGHPHEQVVLGMIIHPIWRNGRPGEPASVTTPGGVPQLQSSTPLGVLGPEGICAFCSSLVVATTLNQHTPRLYCIPVAAFAEIQAGRSQLFGFP